MGQTHRTMQKGLETHPKGELSEGVGGSFGGLPLFSTATSQQRRDCPHSEATPSKSSRREGRCEWV